MSEFIKMQKGEETIEVNPLCVADHESLGWVVVEAPLVEEEVLAERKPDQKKSHASRGKKPAK